MNWLITGGCGFIGGRLIQRIAASGERLRILDNLSVGSASDLAPLPVMERPVAAASTEWTANAIELFACDIRDTAAVTNVARGADVIVHLAANTGVQQSIENPRLDCEVNVLGTLNCLEAARAAKARRFVYASSGAPLAGREPPLHEDMAIHPIAPYGASKAAGEAYCLAYHGCFGLETVGLRFGNVYGPGSGHKQSVVAKFLRSALAGETLEIHGDGGQTRDFVFVDDLVEAIELAAVVQGVGGELFQVATQRESTVQEMAELVAEVVAARTGRPVQVKHGPARIGDAHRNFSDVSKSRSRLGYTPKTSLRDGIGLTLDYFLNARAPAIV
jgi:UDP-glucose 4-epimerase